MGIDRWRFRQTGLGYSRMTRTQVLKIVRRIKYRVKHSDIRENSTKYGMEGTCSQQLVNNTSRTDLSLLKH